MESIIDSHQEKLEHIEKQIKSIYSYCSTDKLQKAWRILQGIVEDLERMIAEAVEESVEREAFVSKLEQIKSNARFTRLLEEQKEVEELVRTLAPTDVKSEGWVEVSEKSGISCYYKDNGSGMHSMRMEGIVESPLFDVCAVVMEIGLYKTWVPKLSEVNTLGSDNRFRRLVYARGSLPWPVADRDIVLYGYGVDMLEDHQELIVIARSVRDGDLEGIDWSLPAELNNVVRAETRISGFIVKPIDEKRTYVKMMALCDPRMSLVPYWLLNFITSQFCHHLFVMLRKQTKTVHTSKVYQDKIKNNPVYTELKEKCLNFKMNQNITNDTI